MPKVKKKTKAEFDKIVADMKRYRKKSHLHHRIDGDTTSYTLIVNGKGVALSDADYAKVMRLEGMKRQVVQGGFTSNIPPKQLSLTKYSFHLEQEEQIQ